VNVLLEEEVQPCCEQSSGSWGSWRLPDRRRYRKVIIERQKRVWAIWYAGMAKEKNGWDTVTDGQVPMSLPAWKVMP